MTQRPPWDPDGAPPDAGHSPWAPAPDQPTMAHPFGPPQAPQQPQLGGYPSGPVPGGPPPGAVPPATPGPPPPGGGHPRVWPKVLAALVAVVVLAGLLVGSYELVKRDPADRPTAAPRHSPRHSPSSLRPSPTPSPRDVSSRRTDPAPLTVHEVFGSDSIRPDPGRDAVYHVLKRDTPRTHCAEAATGKVDDVLHRYGCDQVVRATLATPTDGYVATAGICNLADAAGARSASDAITALGKQTEGSFSGLSAPGPAAELDSSATVFALQPYGHYLLYVVIGRSDGKPPGGNADIRQIITDLVQTYLTGVVDHRRDHD